MGLRSRRPVHYRGDGCDLQLVPQSGGVHLQRPCRGIISLQDDLGVDQYR